MVDGTQQGDAPDPKLAELLKQNGELSAKLAEALRTIETAKTSSLDAGEAQSKLGTALADLGKARGEIEALNEAIGDRDVMIRSRDEQITDLTRQLKEAHASALPKLPEGLFELTQSATIAVIVDGKAARGECKAGDVLAVGANKRDLERAQQKFGARGRKVYAVSQETLDELKGLGFIFV